MIIDTSALLAILQDEPERRMFNEAIEMADSRRVSAATFVEASIVIESRLGTEGLRAFDRFMERAEIEIIGRHAAGLNFGDCFSYALAIVLGEPLLFKGEDFARTDVMPVDSSDNP